MDFVTVLQIVQVVGIAVASLVAFLAWRRRETRGAVPLVGMCTGAVIWGTTSLVASQLSTFRFIRYDLNLLYVGVVIAVGSFFVFALEYTGRERYLTRRNLALLAVEPVLVQVAVWTNPYHGLFFASRTREIEAVANVKTGYGPLFWAHTAYSYVLLMAGVGMLLLMLYRRQDLYRGQMAAVVITIVVPLASNLASIVPGGLPVDVTTAGFAVSGVALILATFRFDLGDLTPVARSTVVNNIHDGVLVLDERDRVIDVNPMGRRILDVRDESVIGEHASDVLAAYPDVWEYFGDLDRGREEVEVETDQGRRSFHVQVSPLTDDRGRQSGRLFLIHDVTEQTRRERELRRQNEQLDQFASLVSHDLRNPLNVANGYLQAAMDADDPETTRDFVEEVERSHERMEDLIEDVLTLARESQTVEETHPTDLDDLAREAWRNVDTAAATLYVDADQQILADRGRLLRVFENLFRNALDHGPDDVTVRVGEIGEYDPGSVIGSERRGFFVADDGTGIPEDEREDVLADGYTTAADGTGLGLSIVASIVEAHGWELVVAESADGGARFEVTGVSLAGAGERGSSSGQEAVGGQ